eukprot:s604_g14.t1
MVPMTHRKSSDFWGARVQRIPSLRAMRRFPLRGVGRGRSFGSGRELLYEGLRLQRSGDALGALQRFGSAADAEPPVAQAAHNAAGLLLRRSSGVPDATSCARCEPGHANTVLLRSDGSAVAIGKNINGQRNVPPLDEGLAYTQISAGAMHTVFLRSDGTAIATGDNGHGQCNIPALDEGMTYTQVSAGHFHTVLLRSDGIAVAIGQNGMGQGNIPPLDEGMAYTQVAAGGAHTVLLRSDGIAVAIGQNGMGQGNIPPLKEGMAYAQICAASFHTVLLRSDGSAVATGENGRGQCNIPPLDAGTAYTQISAGVRHTVLLRSDGSAVAIGGNESGQFNVPPLDEGLSYTEIAAGAAHTVLLRSDGSAVAIGKNSDEQCNIPLPEPGRHYVGDLTRAGDLTLQVEFVGEDDAVTLICSTLAGTEWLRVTTTGLHSAWETHKRIARELKMNLWNLHLVLPDGQLLAKFCRANPGASVADATQSERVLAPWAEDGFDYEATLEVVDEAAGLCTVAWADGGETCRVVPCAAVTTLDGRPCFFRSDAEQRLWAARRALRLALLDWQQQAEAGVAHDAFVDFAGVAADLAAAELRVALMSSTWPGLELAQSLLRRGCFTAERAYAPAPRALAALVSARAEAMRFETGVDLQELQRLHLRVRDHLHAATWTKEPHWASFGGTLRWETLHQVMWAKALAHVAVSSPAREVGRTPKASADRNLPHHGRAKHRRGRGAVAGTSPVRRSVWALPEKLLPAPSGLPRGPDPLLAVQCCARQGVLRAWRAVLWAAGRDVQSCRLPWTYSADSARSLALELPKTQIHTELLLEVAVLVFAMGCRLGQAARSRNVALQLLMVAQSRASHETLELVQHGVELLTPQAARSWGRWQLLGYRPREELWLLRRRRRVRSDGSGTAVAALPGPPPCSWMLEGVALAELLP